MIFCYYASEQFYKELKCNYIWEISTISWKYFLNNFRYWDTVANNFLEIQQNNNHLINHNQL